MLTVLIILALAAFIVTIGGAWAVPPLCRGPGAVPARAAAGRCRSGDRRWPSCFSWLMLLLCGCHGQLSRRPWNQRQVASCVWWSSPGGPGRDRDRWRHHGAVLAALSAVSLTPARAPCHRSDMSRTQAASRQPHQPQQDASAGPSTAPDSPGASAPYGTATLAMGAQHAALATALAHASVRGEIEGVVLSWVVHARILPSAWPRGLGNVSASFRRLRQWFFRHGRWRSGDFQPPA